MKLKKTEAMNYKTILTISLISLLSSLLAAQGDSEIRSYMKSMPVDNETVLELVNKYGTIHITSWDKDSAYIRAEVRVFAANQLKINKLFNEIDINISVSDYTIRAHTSFSQSINMLFESFKGMTNKMISYDSRVEINYYINLPEYMDIKIENKYGDVYMESTTGILSASVSNGSFRADVIGKGASLTMNFCNATINRLESGRIDAAFSEIAIVETDDIIVKSISSRYEIGIAGTARFESRRDKIFIETIESLKGNSYFSDFNIGNLTGDMNLTTKYGNVNADHIETGFNEITLHSGYSDIYLEFNKNASYSLDIRHINTFLDLPSSNAKTEKKVINEDKKEYMTYGSVGNVKGDAKVKIDATRGNVYLK
jgi:hypothetical protein